MAVMRELFFKAVEVVGGGLLRTKVLVPLQSNGANWLVRKWTSDHITNKTLTKREEVDITDTPKGVPSVSH